MAEPPRLRVIEDGPLVVDGATLARLVKGELVGDEPPSWTIATMIAETGPTFALCRCDGSGKRPFCDRWPDRLPCFDEPPRTSVLTPVFTWRPPDGVDGPLVALKPNGPIRVSGGVRIEREDGTSVDAGERTSLCRCGNSGVMPFCDGSHKEVGFRDA
jgi:CDGSH-type Zn-finger protein